MKNEILYSYIYLSFVVMKGVAVFINGESSFGSSPSIPKNHLTPQNRDLNQPIDSTYKIISGEYLMV